MNASTGIKIIVTMIGLDGHTTGGETVAMILRDAGIEVVYLGCNQTPEMIVEAAIQEDVDFVGISSHASNYDQIEAVVKLLRSKNIDDVPVICGGNIPRHQIEVLKQKGVAAVFPPGSSSETIVGYLLKNRRGAIANEAGAKLYMA
ncbi:MAG: cobalamin-dependent protein [Fimbriimonadaceae bacterium]|jgi:methylmalonyl-CoA mutase C-terminal domain/subunit|nr:cobalamin-dependent protein [Alphaproteobacteria bacterium]